MKNNVEFLATIPIFAGLFDGDAADLERAGQLMFVRKKQVAYRPGDPSDAISRLLHDETVVEPVPADVAYYEEAFQTIYKQIYPALQAINHRSFDLQQKVTAGP